MVAFWLGIPADLRCLLVALFGLAGGALANWVIYRFAYFNPRPISPWGPIPEGADARTMVDRIPVVGWFFLQRESKLHGAGFWIRPMLIELGSAAALVGLFWFETQSGGLLPIAMRVPRALGAFELYATHIFFAHAVLFVLMVAATFIDFDERTIPDVITIPGTLLGLVIASMTTLTFMPTPLPAGAPVPFIPTTFEAPWFAGDPAWVSGEGLLWALAIWSLWCFALADRRWSGVILRRRGVGRAVRHFMHGLFLHGFWKVLVAMWCLGTVGIWMIWSMGGTHWQGLLTALCGLAIGGGVIWSIRIVATWALQMEAMGFGDVTLMAMIGAFLGWQAALIAFFLSPFAAIVIVLIRYLVTRDAYTPFGPYLCAGAMLTILFWDRVYNDWLANNLLLMGPILLWLPLAMLGLMGVMLFVWRLIKIALFRGAVE
ncbi:MAG: prepilin peptidase [Rubripirellula sp.]